MPKIDYSQEAQNRFMRVMERVTEEDLVDALVRSAQALNEYLLKQNNEIALAKLTMAVAHGARLAAAWE